MYFLLCNCFGCPMAYFGSLSRGQPHSPNIKHCVYVQTEGHGEPHTELGSLIPAECLVGFEPSDSDNSALTLFFLIMIKLLLS